MKLQKIIDLVVLFALAAIVTAPAHEFCHYQIGTWFGGSGFSVTYPSFITGLIGWSVRPDPAWPMYLAGGFLTGVAMWLLAWRAIRTPTHWDEDVAFTLSILGTAQIAYSLGELSRAFEVTKDYWYTTSSVLIVLFLIPVLWWRLPKLVKYIENDVT